MNATPILGTLPAGALRPGDRVVVGANVHEVRSVQAVGCDVRVALDVGVIETWRVTLPVTVVT